MGVVVATRVGPRAVDTGPVMPPLEVVVAPTTPAPTRWRSPGAPLQQPPVRNTPTPMALSPSLLWWQRPVVNRRTGHHHHHHHHHHCPSEIVSPSLSHARLTMATI